MKKLFAILLSILLAMLIFASCDTGGEEVSSEPVSEVSSVEVSSSEESSKEEKSEVSSEEEVDGEAAPVRDAFRFDDSWSAYTLTKEESSFVEKVFFDRWVFFFHNPFGHPTHIRSRDVLLYALHQTYEDAAMMSSAVLTVEQVNQAMQKYHADIPDDWVFQVGDMGNWEYDDEKKEYRNNNGTFGLGGVDMREYQIVSAFKNKDNTLLVKIELACDEDVPDEIRDGFPDKYYDFYYVQENGNWKLARIDDKTDWLDSATYEYYEDTYISPLYLFDFEFDSPEDYLKTYNETKDQIPQYYFSPLTVFLYLNDAFELYDGEKLWAIDPYEDEYGWTIRYFLPLETVAEMLEIYMGVDCRKELRETNGYDAQKDGFYLVMLNGFGGVRFYNWIEYVRECENGVEICACYGGYEDSPKYYAAYVIDEHEDGSFTIYSIDIRSTVYPVN